MLINFLLHRRAHNGALFSRGVVLYRVRGAVCGVCTLRIRLAPLDRPAFPDNLVAAYAALDSQRGARHQSNGVTGAELQRLLAVRRTDSNPPLP